MAIDRSKQLLTYEDYAALPYDGKRYELIDGELQLVPAPTLSHQDLAGQIYLLLRLYLGSHPGGRVFISPVDVVLGPHQVLQPDVLYVSPERLKVLTEPNVQGAPDLVVEVLSTGTSRRDTGRKRQLYDEYGVREYWIVHQKVVEVDVYRRGAAGRLARVASLEAGDVLETPVLPGLHLAVASIYQLPGQPG